MPHISATKRQQNEKIFDEAVIYYGILAALNKMPVQDAGLTTIHRDNFDDCADRLALSSEKLWNDCETAVRNLENEAVLQRIADGEIEAAAVRFPEGERIESMGTIHTTSSGSISLTLDPFGNAPMRLPRGVFTVIKGPTRRGEPSGLITPHVANVEIKNGHVLQISFKPGHGLPDGTFELHAER
jgi:hypothetical protein